MEGAYLYELYGGIGEERRIFDDSSSSDEGDYEGWLGGVPDGEVYLNENTLRYIERDDAVFEVRAHWTGDLMRSHALNVNWKENGRHLGENTSIKILTISGFDDTGGKGPRSTNFRDFCQGLAQNRSIEMLAISGCKFETNLTALALESLALFVRNNRKLCFVEITGCTINFQNMLQLDFLRGNSLHGVSFTRNKCPALAKQRLFEGLAGQDQLKELDVRGCKMGWSATIALSKLVNAPRSQIADVNLKATSMDDASISFFVKTLAKNKTLKSLSLEGNPAIDALGCMTLSNYLRQPCCALTFLDLSCNALNDVCILHLARGLVGNTSLRILDLVNNQSITTGAWRNFSWNYDAIEVLDLSGNAVGYDFVVDLPNRLQDTKSLRVLGLSQICWKLTTSEMRSLAFCLSSNSALEELHIERNGVDDEGAVMLKTALSHNTSLKKLNLDGNPHITGRGWSEFVHLLCDKSSIDLTFASNHSLESLGQSTSGVFIHPSELDFLLTLNMNGDKMAAARRKILRTHFRDESKAIQTFLGMGLSILPHAIAWMAKDCAGFSLLNKVLVSLPSLLGRSNDPDCKKRKREYAD